MLGLSSLLLAWLSQPCTITVSGLPVPARTHHHLEVTGGEVRLDRGALEVKLAVDDVVVRLVGPRYTGGLRVRLTDCADGRVLSLQARPRPAAVTFENAPTDLVLRCIDACPANLSRTWMLARELPPLPVEHGLRVEVELRAPGHVRSRRVLDLLPGPNAIPLRLRRIDGSQSLR
ncbi:MAG: hypothetical protein IPH07_04145 [Deltaproteobacteria bacterium]|nr:hypothetical protein [Deltaproteobacteria bacterium]MBP7289744.1 hypothetical protein [Nannocystaceae bacterium]